MQSRDSAWEQASGGRWSWGCFNSRSSRESTGVNDGGSDLPPLPRRAFSALVSVGHMGGGGRKVGVGHLVGNIFKNLKTFKVSSAWKQKKGGDTTALIKAFMWKLLSEIWLQLRTGKAAPRCLLCRWGETGQESTPNLEQMSLLQRALWCDLSEVTPRVAGKQWKALRRRCKAEGSRVLMVHAEGGKHSRRHATVGTAVGLGLGLLQRFDLHLEIKNCTCLRFSYLHLRYATQKATRHSFNRLVNTLTALTLSHFWSCQEQNSKGESGRCSPWLFFWSHFNNFFFFFFSCSFFYAKPQDTHIKTMLLWSEAV